MSTPASRQQRSPARCTTCRRRLLGRAERDRGICSSCEVASWPEWKRKAIRTAIGRAVRGDQTGAEAAIDRYFDKLEEDKQARKAEGAP